MKNILVVAVLVTSTCLSAGGLVFGEPLFSGPGCPGGSVSYLLSPNNNSLSILFNQFSLAANSGMGTVRTFCGIILKVTTHNQTILEADYRGFHDLTAGSSSNSSVTYTLDNHIPQNQLDTVSGPDTNVYLNSHQANITCAGTRVLKIFVDSILSNLSGPQNSTYSLDSIDLAEAAVPNITLALCNSGVSIASSWIPVLVSLSVLLFAQMQ